MNGINKKFYLRALSLLMAAVLICSMFAGCGAGAEEIKDPVLSYEETELPLSFYLLLLSRAKGTFARNGHDVNSPEFWSSEYSEGVTYADYVEQGVLESCKRYLASLVIFEEEGLSLPQSILDEIDEEVDFYIDYDGKKDENAFNELISKYGIDDDDLRRAYIIEAKSEYLLAHLYGEGKLIGDTVKDEYYRKHYYRFKQILISDFYYKYEKDEQGNMIYFDPEDGEPLYDTENGVYVYDASGNHIKDEYGNTIYYDKDGKILYDTENGQPSVTVDADGQGIKYYYSEAEKAERKAKAEEIVNTISKGNFSAFEAEKTNWVQILGADEPYPDGYYLSETESAGYSEYMLDILDALKEMAVGDIRMIKSDSGYHIVMKYELDSGKYSDSKYAEWFGGFNSTIINDLYSVKIEEYLKKIDLNTENLEKAMDVEKIGINFDY